LNTTDLRSDTLTQPTKKMRTAMAEAAVGDDVFSEDPTVNDLEKIAASRMGKEAAIFVPSGTMGNLISMLSHCNRGDEVILGDQSHIFLNEVGGIAALGGIHPHIISNELDGTINLEIIEKTIRASDLHYPPTRVIALENTHNYCMGSPIGPEYMQKVGSLAKRYNLKIHVDGARIFNASVAMDVDVKDLVSQVSSVMFCLSKGLSAPVGSLVCGNKEFIAKARKWRKMVGGGMRQSGHLAAAGIIALNELVDELKKDHYKTQALAQGLSKLKRIILKKDLVKTNIIFFSLKHPTLSSEEFLKKLETEGIKILMIQPKVFRIVLHREISESQVERVIHVFEKLTK
jgi:threonine aldolase